MRTTPYLYAVSCASLLACAGPPPAADARSRATPARPRPRARPQTTAPPRTPTPAPRILRRQRPTPAPPPRAAPTRAAAAPGAAKKPAPLMFAVMASSERQKVATMATTFRRRVQPVRSQWHSPVDDALHHQNRLRDSQTHRCRPHQRRHRAAQRSQRSDSHHPSTAIRGGAESSSGPPLSAHRRGPHPRLPSDSVPAPRDASIRWAGPKPQAAPWNIGD